MLRRDGDVFFLGTAIAYKTPKRNKKCSYYGFYLKTLTRAIKIAHIFIALIELGITYQDE